MSTGRGGDAPGKPARTKACLFAGGRLVLPDGAGSLPGLAEARGWNAGESEWFPATAARPFASRSSGALAARAAPGWSPPEGVSAVSLRDALALLRESDAGIALTAAHLARWRDTTRFCGACGHATEPSRRHRAMVCRSCGHLAFPKVSPAVIVQVTRGDRILLGRSRRHPKGGYSVLAGFVDPGERLEDAVLREIEEESGVRVRSVRYFGSQPWPFPDSLMVGFTAVHDSGEIRRRDDELEDVAWFRAHEAPACAARLQHRTVAHRRLRPAQRRRSGADSHVAAVMSGLGWRPRPARGCQRVPGRSGPQTRTRTCARAAPPPSSH